MDDKNPTKQDGEHSEASAPPVEAIEPHNPKPTSSHPTQQLAEVAHELTGFEKSTLRWTRTAVVLSGLAAFFVCAQWWEMRKGGADTHSLATSASTQAGDTHTLAQQAVTQAIQTTNLATASGTQAIAAGDFAQSAAAINKEITKAEKDFSQMAKNSEGAIKATQESMRQDQRAWVSAELGTGIPKAGEDFEIIFPIKNTGRTPAKNVVVMFAGNYFRIGEKVTYNFVGDPQPLGAVAPDSPTVFRYQGSADQKDWITSHASDRFVVYGAITYEDIFDAKHWSTYCFYVSPQKDYVYCNEHNDVGDGPLPADALQY